MNTPLQSQQQSLWARFLSRFRVLAAPTGVSYSQNSKKDGVNVDRGNLNLINELPGVNTYAICAPQPMRIYETEEVAKSVFHKCVDIMMGNHLLDLCAWEVLLAENTNGRLCFLLVPHSKKIASVEFFASRVVRQEVIGDETLILFETPAREEYVLALFDTESAEVITETLLPQGV